MTGTTRRIAAAGSLSLFLGLTAACGGSDGPRTDASVKEFCSAVSEPDLAQEDMADKAKIQAAMEKWVDGLEKTGTPEDIPDDAREGFEIGVRQFDQIDWNKSLEQIGKEVEEIESDLSKAEKKKVDAFDAYQEKTCD